MFPLKDPILLFYLIAALLYIPVAILGLSSRVRNEPLALSLAGYCLLSVALLCFWDLRRLGLLSFLQPGFLLHILAYGSLLLSWYFIELNRTFLPEKISRPRGWLPALLAILVLIVFDSNALNLPDTLLKSSSIYLARSQAFYFLLMVGWAAFTLAAIAITLRSYNRTQQPLHRNRLKYWAPILALNVIGDLLIFAGWTPQGTFARLLSAWLILPVFASHDLPDVRETMRRLLSYVMAILLVIIVYEAGYILSDNLLQTTVGYGSIWSAIIMVVVVVLLFRPVLEWVQKQVNRMLSGNIYNPTQFLHKYSASISNILDLERLADLAVGMIGETLKASNGVLCLVQRREGQDGLDYFLEQIQHDGVVHLAPLVLSVDSPIASFFRTEQRPLTQYDIDLHPQFRSTSSDEKSWFQKTGMDVYVPILLQGEWIGLLILGPKISGDSYYDEDIILLGTLAGQTAVALENARLVNDLVHLNQELKNAYFALNQSNQKLEKLDRAKSDFISIASHELRTPLTLLMGYSQMMADDPTIRANPDSLKMLAGIKSGTSRLYEIVASMLDMAEIDNRTLKLHTQPIQLVDLIISVVKELGDSVEERHLQVDLSGLGKDLFAMADRDALKKVFYHLIVNAIKYTQDGGTISISASNLSPSDSPLYRNSVEVIVSDTGIGIDPHYHELIFTKFYQTGEIMLHSTGKTKFKGGGPGLGLAIVRGIVQAHNGKVWVESRGFDETSCPGSQFHVVLPLP